MWVEEDVGVGLRMGIGREGVGRASGGCKHEIADFLADNLFPPWFMLLYLRKGRYREVKEQRGMNGGRMENID